MFNINQNRYGIGIVAAEAKQSELKAQLDKAKIKYIEGSKVTSSQYLDGVVAIASSVSEFGAEPAIVLYYNPTNTESTLDESLSMDESNQEASGAS